MGETSVRLKENVAGFLCYLLGWITGLIFLVIEPKNRFVRFQALQSIVVFGVLTVILLAVGLLTDTGYFFGILLFLGALCWVWLMAAAYFGLQYRLPLVGNLVEKWLT
ncbi:MAG: hypothetical protein C4555_06165 [Dehalococcoidia bacterium]|jgi:uncharacterized membrane protein|nr:MAG: hypothetical protein C4555_06165 [Dehalococcoidia bacterium]